ncbi:MAG TPA: hypothetical protein VFE45_15065, partial [Coriobacteriia bacterium]|nr:hypothetical protein [Coriobacteriia bacterium]
LRSSSLRWAISRTWSLLIWPTLSRSGEPNRDKVGQITRDQVREIAQRKLEDLNAHDVDQASKIIEGTARSMGVEVV